MLTCLIDLMAAPLEEEADEEGNMPNETTKGIEESPLNSSPDSPINPTTAATSMSTDSNSGKVSVAANPSPISHLPSMPHLDSELSKKNLWANSDRVEAEQRAAAAYDTGAGSPHSSPKAFFPNSLVIVGASALLESIVSSRRDTSSPELLNRVLDMLAKRCEILVHMLRSSAFIIMENAAILIFVLLRNRPAVAPMLKEMCLSECLVLKHFYNGAFSPSAAQRFISRFLVATWMAGNEKSSPGKALLARILPSGLVEYLKFKVSYDP